MNKNINNIVELTEKELEGVVGGAYTPKPTESAEWRAEQIKKTYAILRGKGLSHEQALKQLKRIKKDCGL